MAAAAAAGVGGTSYAGGSGSGTGVGVCYQGGGGGGSGVYRGRHRREPTATPGCLESMSQWNVTQNSLSTLPLIFIASLENHDMMGSGVVTNLTQFILSAVSCPFVMTASLIEGVVRLIFSGFYYGASLMACNDETKKDLRHMGYTLWKSSVEFGEGKQSCAMAFVFSPAFIAMFFLQIFTSCCDD